MNEAELLFSQILNCNRLSLYLNKDLKLDKDKSHFVSCALKRRVLGEPIQYILGKTEFMGLEFEVNRDVFIPRPETEILVETTLSIVRKFECSKVRMLRILDIGTGSGCIAISLAKLLPNVSIDAIDISIKALEIARFNARLHNVNINFIQSDLFTKYEIRITNYDIIVCNPPYIPTAEIELLQSEVKYEPHIALDGGRDGLDFYRRIISDSGGYLKEGGFLIMEMGVNQTEVINNIIQNAQDFKMIEVIKDYNNIDRVIVAQLK